MLRIKVDAAHTLHKDGKGHEGTIGSVPNFSKSFKIKLVTQSSTVGNGLFGRSGDIRHLANVTYFFRTINHFYTPNENASGQHLNHRELS